MIPRLDQIEETLLRGPVVFRSVEISWDKSSGVWTVWADTPHGYSIAQSEKSLTEAWQAFSAKLEKHVSEILAGGEDGNATTY